MNVSRKMLVLIVMALSALVLLAACSSKEEATPTLVPTVALPATATPEPAATESVPPAEDQVWSRIEASRQIVVGTSADYPPFEYYDASFGLVGFDVALIREIGDRLGLEVVVKDMAFDGLEEAVLLGQVDVAIAAIAMTPERAELVDFSNVYFLTEDAILAKDQVAVNSLRDLAGRRVGVQHLSVYQDWAQEELVDTGLTDASNLIVYRDMARSFEDLGQGLIDFAILDLPPAQAAADARGFSIAAQGLNRQRLGIALPMGAVVLQAQLNRALGEMQAQGRIEALAQEYLGLDKEDLLPVPTPDPSQPTPTPRPPSPPQGCIDGMEWVADLSYDDNNMRNPPQIAPGQPFVKGWRVRNSGTCAWDGAYALVYVSGNVPAARMGGQPAVVDRQVEQNQTHDFNVNLVAPLTAGTYQGFWTMRNGDGELFGDKVWVGIQVPGQATPTPPPTQTPSPNIQFTVDRNNIKQGECVNFSWNAQNVQAVYFYADGQNWQDQGVSGQSSRTECPKHTTTYNLRVVFRDGNVEVRSIRIDVAAAPSNAPSIARFAVNPEGQITVGQCVNISWDVQGEVNNVRLTRNNNDLWNPAPASGNIQDCPPGPGGYGYVLEANGPGGTSKAQRSVNVVESVAPPPTATPVPATPAPNPPVINAFAANPNQIETGQCVQVSWRASGGTTSVQILRNGAIVLDNAPLEGSEQDCIQQSGNVVYRLVASNNAGQSDFREASVGVQDGAPQNPLAGTSWRATSFSDGAGGVSQPMEGANMTAAFGGNGSVHGSGGCNSYSASYTVNGNALSIGGLSATQQQCGEHEGIDMLEFQYLNALQSAASFSMEAGQLYILNAGGQAVIEFVGQ
jgi:polar amino acid transport system substrate-binding protein